MKGDELCEADKKALEKRLKEVGIELNEFHYSNDPNMVLKNVYTGCVNKLDSYKYFITSRANFNVNAMSKSLEVSFEKKQGIFELS